MYSCAGAASSWAAFRGAVEHAASASARTEIAIDNLVYLMVSFSSGYFEKWNSVVVMAFVRAPNRDSAVDKK